MLAIYNSVKPYIVEEGEVNRPYEWYTYKKWSNGYFEANGRFVSAKFEKDQHGARLYNLPFRLNVNTITVLSQNENCTSTYYWRPGFNVINIKNGFGGVRIRGKFVDFATGVVAAPDDYTEGTTWSITGQLEP